MAKVRQTDVNINYKVNDVEIQKSNALLNRASKATDDLRRSSDAYAKTAAAGNSKTSTSIAGMTLQMQRLKAQIELTNKSDTKRLTQLSGEYKSLKSQVDAYNKALLHTNTSTKQATQSSQGMAQQFGQVYTAIRLIIAAGLARELVNISLSAATLTGNIEGVERAFTRAFPQSKTLIQDLREATHGAVSDFELMKRTLQATNLGVNVDHLATLFEFAATRAQQTGESVDYLVDSIVRGIGRKSILVLDNLGLSATRLKEQFNGASIASKSVAEVTEGVAAIAKVELDKMGGYLETSKTQVDQLAVAWTELRQEAAKALTADEGGGIVGYMRDYVNSFRVLIKAFNEGKTVQEVFAQQQREQIALVSANEFINRRFTKDKQENIQILKEEIQAITEDLGVYARFRDKMEDVNAEKKKELDALGNIPSLRDGEKSAIRETIALNDRMLKSKKDDALIDQEILKILQSKLIALEKVNKEQDKPDKRGFLQKPLTKVVDIRFKDPKTGRISKEHFDKILTDMGIEMQAVTDALPPVTIPITPFIPMDEWEKALEANREDIINVSSGVIQEQIDSILFAEVDSYSKRIDAARAFYSEQIALAGDNERAKQEFRIKEEREVAKLEKERADREKKASLASIRVNTALSIIKVFAGGGTFFDKLIRVALVTAQGASQYAAASRAQYYAKGVIDLKGPGTKTSDSIPAMLSRGESVMTADETIASKGIFKAVRAKKLNDAILKNIVSGRSGGTSVASFDDSRLLRKLDEVKNSQPDITQRANLIYETRKLGDKYKRTIRSKSMGS